MFLFMLAAMAGHVDQSVSANSSVPKPDAPVTQPAPSPEGFVIGVDTIGTVTAKLGQPQNSETGSDGNTTMTYSDSKTHAKAATFVPIVGIFAGGAKGHATTKTFVFGPDQRLTRYSTRSTNINCHTHFAGFGCH